MALPGRFKAIALTTGSPTLSAPDMYVYRAPPIEFFDGQVEVDTDWQLGDPEVWPLNSLKLDPEDGVPIKEALFSRHNADMAISVDGQSLVGRSALARGPAHKIRVDPPLIFSNRILTLDPAFKPGGDAPPSMAFRAHKNGVTQTAASANYTKLTFGFEDYDLGNRYNPTLSRWTPPLGLVHVDVSLFVASGVTANTYILAAIYKNGVIAKQGVVYTSSSNGGSQVSLDDVANGTDYYETYIWVSGPAPVVDGSPINSYFSGHVPSGQQGVQGIQGPIGLTGPQGPQGVQGVQGLIGPTGPTGPTGPQGPQGVQGPIGLTGPTGNTGTPGALWYQGAGIPAAGIGISGDYFLRVSTGDIYQKAGTTWSLVGNIKGPQGLQGIQGLTGADSTVPGPQGIQGNKGDKGDKGDQGIQGVQGIKGDVGSLWYDGGGAPAAGLGVNGDFYLNHANGDVYQKAGGAWGLIANIKGPQGIQGIQGITGAVGPATMWYSGAANPVVGLGTNGDFYFNTTNATVWQKSAGAWGQISTIAGGGTAIGFHAYKTAAQAVTASTSTKVIFEIELYDNGGLYDTSLHRWTPPAGLVHIDAVISASGMTAGVGCIIELWKNGVVFKSASNVPSIGSDGTQLSIDDNASGTSYYEIYVRLSGSPSVAGGQTCYWSGHVVSAQGPTGPQGIQGTQGPIGPQGIQGVIGPGSTVPGPPATYPTSAHSFSAQKAVDQSVPSATWTKIDFGTELYDTGLHYDPVTSRYTPFAGDAVFIASVYCSGLLTGSNVYIAIYKNGALYRAATNNTTNNSAQIICSDNASGTDYYEAWVYAYTASGNFTIPAAETNLLFFQGFQPTGPQGIQGIQGIQGLKGDVGSLWYDGAGTPAGALARDNDWYLNHTTGDVFQKISGTWTAAGNIRGPQGIQGIQGITGFGIVQIGTVPPASPSVGNFWYDTSTGILSVWIDDGSSSQWIQVSPTINLDTSLYVSITSPAFQGVPTAPTAAPGTNTAQIATTAFVTNSPVFTGDPQAPTPATSDNDTSIATTAFVKAALPLAVRYDAAQTLTAPQQAQARSNIAAAQVTAFDTSWKPFPYVNGWVDYGAPYGPCGYRLLPNGLVILKGLVMSGTAATIFTFPAGYRPGVTLLLNVQTSPNVACRIDISAAGVVSHTGGSNGWISLGGISFLAEN
jgi:hypothetical protein